MTERRPDMTDEELKQLAVDIYHGKAFTDRSVRPSDVHLIPQLFMPIALGGPDMAEMFKAEEVTMIYEYIDKAHERSLNGYPMFFSFRYLRRGENDRLAVFFDRYRQLQEEFTGEAK